MENVKEKEQLFQILCPCCQSLLWIDPVTQEVIQFEKRGGKKRETLEELLLKEKKRKAEFERKFEATAELERKRLKNAEEGFKKALTKFDNED